MARSAAVRLSAEELAQFEKRGVALVLYNRTHATIPVASVCCEFAGGEQLLVDGLVGAGRRSFAIIGGPEDSTVGEARVQGALARDRRRRAAIAANLARRLFLRQRSRRISRLCGKKARCGSTP